MTEAAAKWGVPINYISKWLKQGKVKAARFRNDLGRWEYKIGDDQKCPEFKRRQKRPTPPPIYVPPCTAKKIDLPPELHMQFIWQNQNRYTIKTLRTMLGLTHAEVMGLYNRAYHDRPWPFPNEKE